MLSFLITIAASVLAHVTLWYVYAQRVQRLDVADRAWGLAQPLIVVVAILITKNFSVASFIMFFLTFTWGYRLFSHIYKRHKKTTEDARYVEMKSGWNRFPNVKAYLYVFVFQGLLMYILGLASMLLIFDKPDFNPLSLIGLFIWMIGFFFEALADRQLKKFVSAPQNKGKILDSGLWKYSRHPNYFGEVTMWWGIFTFAYLNTNILWTIVTPITITYLIVFVSGIPLTEKHFETNPLWQKYKEKTSILIPWPNKKS